MKKNISVIIPALNEEQHIAATLQSAVSHDRAQVIVVDGGSTDRTVARAEALGVPVLSSPPGKGRQMNLGADIAAGSVLLFLHADTILPTGYARHVAAALSRPKVAAGAFSLHIAAAGAGFRLIEAGANLRSKLLGLPYGDQAVFTTRNMFQQLGGFPETPIMEDYLLVRKLRKQGRILILPQIVSTSPRRWHNMGIFRTTFINQIILLAHALGCSPETLVRLYQRARGKGTSA